MSKSDAPFVRGNFADRCAAQSLRCALPMQRTALTLTALAALVATAGCSSAPAGDAVGNSSEAISGSTIISRGMEWVNAGLHYCQSSQGSYDGDSSCWGWEGPSHRCDRQSNSAWNAYRSDCSGFITYAWGLPPVGDGGYVTSEFAPFDNAFSHTIDGHQLQPGDALNLTTNEHILLFKHWLTVGQSAVFMEEPGCSSSTPYAHEFTSNVSISGSEVYISYEGATFYAIRYNGSGGGGGGSDPCSYGNGYCTSTMQCDSGQWVPRSSDATACTSGPASSGGGGMGNSCSDGNGYCTSTLQCDNGHWVQRTSDRTKCTSGPGVSGGSSGGGSASDACSHGDGYCTGTLQCDNGHWIARSDDSATCTSIVNATEGCSGGDGYCTATLQCENGHWVTRSSDPAACTSGPR